MKVSLCLECRDVELYCFGYSQLVGFFHVLFQHLDFLNILLTVKTALYTICLFQQQLKYCWINDLSLNRLWIVLFWDVTSCSLIIIYQHFWTNLGVYLKMEAIGFFAILI
jgi:hypothetical protein